MVQKIASLILLRFNQIKRLAQSIGIVLLLIFIICIAGITTSAIQSVLKLNSWWIILVELCFLMIIAFNRKDKSFLYSIFESRAHLIFYHFTENVIIMLPFLIYHLANGHMNVTFLIIVTAFITALCTAFIPEKADTATKTTIRLITLKYFELKFIAEKSPIIAVLFCLFVMSCFIHIIILLIWIFLLIGIILTVFTPFEPMEMIHYEHRFVLKKMISYTKILTLVVIIPFVISILFHPEHWLVASYALICAFLALYLAISAKYAAYTPLRALRHPTVSESIIVMLMLLPGGAIITASFVCLKYIKAENNLKTLYATD